jgi:hypothetical protein
MARKPSAERLAEFQTYLGFFRALGAFQEKLYPELRRVSALPDGRSAIEAGAAWAEDAARNGTAPFSALLTGVKQAVGDQLEMTRELPQETVRLADEFLATTGALSLTEMRRRVWRVVPKVLERGAIRTIDEFYVVKNVLDDGGHDLSHDDRARLETMRFEFETRPTRPRRSPPSGKRAVRRRKGTEGREAKLTRAGMGPRVRRAGESGGSHA